MSTATISKATINCMIDYIPILGEYNIPDKFNLEWTIYYFTSHRQYTHNDISRDNVILPRGYSQKLYQCLRDRYDRIYLSPYNSESSLVTWNCLMDIPVLRRQIVSSMNISKYIFLISVTCIELQHFLLICMSGAQFVMFIDCLISTNSKKGADINPVYLELKIFMHYTLYYKQWVLLLWLDSIMF